MMKKNEEIIIIIIGVFLPIPNFLFHSGLSGVQEWRQSTRGFDA